MHFVEKLFNKYSFFTYLFLAAIFLIKIPPFYYFPIPNKMFSSHSLAKVIIGIVFFIFFLINRNKMQSVINKKKLVFLLILFYLISQTISIINAFDIILFWKSYHNLFIILFVFFLSFLINSFFKQTTKLLEYFFIFTGITVIFLELFFLLFPTYSLSFFSYFIQQEVLDAYLTNFYRGRFSLDLNIELFLPIFLVAALFSENKKNYKSILFFVISLIIVFLSITSNVRTRVIGAFFSIFMVLIFYFKRVKFKKGILNLVIFVLIFFTIGNLAIRLSNNVFRFNIIDRFLLEERNEDIGSVNYRVASLIKSYEIFRAFPITGIGLGNFVYFNSQATGLKYSLTINKSEKNYHELVLYSPHNIFAQILSETGILGIISFSILIIYFLIKDIRLLDSLKGNNKYTYSYIISSWEILIYALFNPASTIFTIGWFWFLRGIIEATSIQKIMRD